MDQLIAYFDKTVLTWLVGLPLLGFFFILFTPRQSVKAIRNVSVGVMLFEFLVSLHLLRNGDPTDVQVTVAERPQPGTQERGGDEESGISIAEAINIARRSVADAGLMTSIDNASAERDNLDGTPVWRVSLTGEGKSATIIVDANSGEVLELELQ